ncbi:MAG: Omp28-related outer membrane protein [Bacteroidales bacterium]|nr:Omp28-related outer membrane protein [Bacteroidales bacterium]
MEQATGFATASRGVRNISIVDANTVWISAYDGSGSGTNIQEFSKTTNGGNTWTPGSINVGNSTLGIAMLHAISASTAYAVAYTNSASPGGQGVFITTDGGSTWSRQTTADYQSSTSFTNVVYFWDANNGFCMGDPISGEFEIYTTTDGGTNWNIVSGANIPNPLNGEYGYVGQYAANGDHIWFSTNKGRLYHSADRGYTWTVAQTPVSDFGGSSQSANFDFTSSTNGLIIDNNNALYETTDGGDTWASVSATGHYAWDVAAVPGNTGTYVNTGNNDGVSYTNFNGHLWTQLTLPGQILETAWFDSSTGWAGSFNTDASTGGIYKFNGTIPSLLNNDLGVIDVTNPVSGTVLTNSENIKVLIMNMGINPQSNFDVSYSLNGGTTVTETVSSTINSGEILEYTFSSNEDLSTPGFYNIIANTTIAGDENSANDAITVNPALLGFLPTKAVVYEEGTGTWCGWCVRGLVGLNTMAEDHTDGTWIGIGVHNGDPMVVAEHDNAIGTYIGGYPSGIMDRHSQEVDPGLASLEPAYQNHLLMVPLAKVEVASQTWNSTSRDLSVEVATTFGLDLSSADYNVAVIIVENGVTGTTSGYNQTNYYAGGSNGDMIDVDGYNYGSTTAPSSRPAAEMVYNHVSRELLGGWAGVSGVVPSSVVYNTAYTHTFTFNLPSTINENNTSYVAILIDNTTGEIENAI